MGSMDSFKNQGHGHVWERPDGMKALCGGPGICRECTADQVALREAVLFTDPIDIAIMIRTKDKWQTEAMSLQKKLAALQHPST